MYQAGQPPKRKRRRITWLVIILIIILLLLLLGLWARSYFRPQTTINQAHAQSSKVTFNSATKHYDEPDFGIDLPATWHAVPRPIGPYQSYSWQSSDQVTNGQVIEIFEDTIPTNFSVNRALIVNGEVNHLSLEGGASDNCAQYTKPVHTTPNQVGVQAKWQGVDFLCDQGNTQRDVIGTSSTDGVNTVILLNQTTGKKHKFFFTYSDYSQNPDYTIFYNALQSVRMN